MMHQPDARTAALLAWLEQLRTHENATDRRDGARIHRAGFQSIKRVEKIFNLLYDDGRPRVLRGALIAKDLVITRRREFFRIRENKAWALAPETVANEYALADLQRTYRELQLRWRSTARRNEKA